MYNKVTYSFMFNIQSCFGCIFTNLKFSCASTYEGLFLYVLPCLTTNSSFVAGANCMDNE